MRGIRAKIDPDLRYSETVKRLGRTIISVILANSKQAWVR
jgi:hypothetical protein